MAEILQKTQKGAQWSRDLGLDISATIGVGFLSGLAAAWFTGALSAEALSTLQVIVVGGVSGVGSACMWNHARRSERIAKILKASRDAEQVKRSA